MVKVKKDLTGQKFGKLLVLEQDEDEVNPKTGQRFAHWKCLCECGKICSPRGTALNGGTTKSCGCLARERVKETLAKNKKVNTYIEKDGYYIGYTLKGEEFFISAEDYDYARTACWYKNSQGYLCTRINNKIIRFHREILNPLRDELVDHINHNTLDNRRENLRICNKSQNAQNMKKRVDNKSGVTGVRWSKAANKWQAVITKNKKVYNLGCYSDFEKAVAARKEAEKNFFGEYAYKIQPY